MASSCYIRWHVLTTEMYITNHARIRLKERCGLPKKAHKRNVSNALLKGIKYDECSGNLKWYLDTLFLSHRNGNNIRIYINYVYIFNHSLLVTVLTLPNNYKAAVNKIIRKRRNFYYALNELKIVS